ncbi:MAG TPA: hypothetical protein VF950_29725 [Planctomycetota bacterium]
MDVFGDFLRPVLEAAGFQRDGGSWTSRRGDVLLSVRGSRDRVVRTLEAGVTFGAGPRMFTLRVHQDVLPQDTPKGPMRGEWWSSDKPVNEASVVETFRCHILRFFDDVSTKEGALAEAAREGKYGDCGPFSRYEPKVNHDAVALLTS